MFLRAAILTLVLGCFQDTSSINDTQDDAPMSNSWLSLEKYFSNDCFFLSQKLNLVIVYTPGEREVQQKDWAWSYEPPDKYIINNHSLTANKNGSCWKVNGAGLEDYACPCAARIPYSFDTGTY
tara:strand:- start:203 stop:574 length:372 start_codon:yes stop_codon:yes gene_type:complete